MFFLKTICAVSLLLVLGACSSMTGPLSDKEYLKLSEAERNKHLSELRSQGQTLERKRMDYWDLGHVVQFEENGVYESSRWDKQKGLIYIYPGFTKGWFDMNTHGVIAVRADSDGTILYEPDGRGGERPTTFLANVATEQGMGRVLVNGGTSVLGSITFGALGARIHAENQTEGANVTLVNQGGVSQSSASAEGVGSASAGASAAVGCATGTCAAPPTN